MFEDHENQNNQLGAVQQETMTGSQCGT